MGRTLSAIQLVEKSCQIARDSADLQNLLRGLRVTSYDSVGGVICDARPSSSSASAQTEEESASTGSRAASSARR